MYIIFVFKSADGMPNRFDCPNELSMLIAEEKNQTMQRRQQQGAVSLCSQVALKIKPRDLKQKHEVLSQMQAKLHYAKLCKIGSRDGPGSD